MTKLGNGGGIKKNSALGRLYNGPSHVSGNFLPFLGKSQSLSSQAARFFSFAKGEKSLLQRNPAHMTRAYVQRPWNLDLQIALSEMSQKCRICICQLDKSMLFSVIVPTQCSLSGPE
jgi:hypothetical protein